MADIGEWRKQMQVLIALLHFIHYDHCTKRLVFTGDRVGVVRASASDIVKIENRSRKRRHKLDGIGVGRIKRVSLRFSFDSVYEYNAYDPVKTGLSELQSEVLGYSSVSTYDSDNLVFTESY